MTKYVAQAFTGQRMAADDNEYIDCELRGCILVYRADGQPPKFSGCELRDTALEFEGPALKTVSLVGAILAPDSPLKGLLAYFPAHMRGGS